LQSYIAKNPFIGFIRDRDHEERSLEGKEASDGTIAVRGRGSGVDGR